MENSILIENIKKQCVLKGQSPTNALSESGVGKSFIADLRRGQTPSVAKVQMLAEYFGVTTSHLLGEKEPPASEDNERLKAVLAGTEDEKVKYALELMDQLTPANRKKAEDYLQYLLDKQADAGGK